MRRDLGLEGFLLDQVEAALIATDPAGMVTFWSRYAEGLLGYPAQEAIGRDLISLVIGFTFYRTKNLIPGIIAHGIFDAVQLFVIIPVVFKMSGMGAG